MVRALSCLGVDMAKAEITQTFDAEGNCLSLTMAVAYDALDSPESLDECVKRAAVLWHITDQQQGDGA